MGGTSLHPLSPLAARSSPQGQPAPWGDMGQEGLLAAAIPQELWGRGQLVHRPQWAEAQEGSAQEGTA